MSNGLISNQELKEKLNCRQDGKVIKWLNDNRIQWVYDAKRKPITTLGAIERHLFKESGEEVDF
jgi:hypothetical protein